MFRLELDGMSEFNQNQTFNQVMDRFEGGVWLLLYDLLLYKTH